ncbi:UbiD family decarboxylase [Natrarchaeobaculum aegyptiacum]|uniref:3-octaprenyl-4-hydroxybenzoate carboxy-lyase n=1 Tax=Natrarchaeobaculum aegyptiacum TaxID=745377 RepID=A0A2Z2HQX8_9EURY|nr:UbiD family decarboxylase [Natrarchaeobaculum aegyptiacum]ARS89560.1 3-octaprenyl-4-hydroxybenzoate carboxy-lyase [Natrarchaeobaculum aegyptiacum]
MTSLRSHLAALREADDLVTIDQHVHWDGTAATVASEAVRHSCPATLFENTAGKVRLASGAYASLDQFENRDRRPWDRLARALDLGANCSYVDLLEHLSTRREAPPLEERLTDEPDLSALPDADLTRLGLPLDRDVAPLVDLGLLVLDCGGETTWAPIRGHAIRSSKLRLAVPEAVLEWPADERLTDVEASVVLGVSAGALVAALQGWTQDRIDPAVPDRAGELADVPVARADSRLVPADAEVCIDGWLSAVDAGPGAPRAAWELASEVALVDLHVDAIATRPEPVVAFTPLEKPLTADVHFQSLVEAAQLSRRANNYWGVSPVEWIRLPVEARLGLCIVSSEILYAGFEWQLANMLFSFSDLFDKVLVLDEQADPTNLARAVDDMWVKAHPANDWTFSEPNAPAATAPFYRRDGTTGSRLYINATWDPRWDEEYIAPRVTLETSFSENVLSSIADRWEELGLDDLLADRPLDAPDDRE